MTSRSGSALIAPLEQLVLPVQYTVCKGGYEGRCAMCDVTHVGEGCLVGGVCFRECVTSQLGGSVVGGAVLLLLLHCLTTPGVLQLLALCSRCCCCCCWNSLTYNIIGFLAILPTKVLHREQLACEGVTRGDCILRHSLLPVSLVSEIVRKCCEILQSGAAQAVLVVQCTAQLESYMVVMRWRDSGKSLTILSK